MSEDCKILAGWLSTLQGRTEQSYRRIVKRFVLALEPKTLKTATLAELRQAVRAIVPEDAGGTTYAGNITAVKSYLRFAHREKHIATDVASLLKAKHRSANNLHRLDEPNDATPAANFDREQLTLLIGFYGGLRMNEISTLTWGDFIALEHGRLLIKDNEGVQREIALPSDLFKALRNARRRYGATDFVF